MKDPFIDQVIGGFRLVRRLGRGGMGLVFEAEEVALRDRKVAVKILPLEFAVDSQAIDRFKREAEIAGSLEHPNIVPVYAVGEELGYYYYAMKYVDGSSLAQAIAAAKRYEPEAQKRRPKDADPRATVASGARAEAAVLLYAEVGEDPDDTTVSSLSEMGPPDALAERRFQRAAEMIAQAAEGLAYAHQKTVIHRDIKPGNLMIDERGNVLIADFGLATDVQSQTLTLSGSLMGTPAYMSPEQIAAQRVPIDHRTDIYSLGATLYELLTLKPPFEAETREKLIHHILVKEPKRPRAHSRRVPRDLDTIAVKALEKDPDRRYPSAGEMAADLRRYLAGEPISARPVGPIVRVMKHLKKHRAAAASVLTAGVLALTAIVLATGISFMTIARERDSALRSRDAAEQAEREATDARDVAEQAVHEAEQARQTAEEAEHQAAVQRDHALHEAYHANIGLVDQKIRQGQLQHAAHLLNACPSQLRSWEWRLLKRLSHPEVLALKGRETTIGSTKLSPDGKWLASGAFDGTVTVWDLHAAREMRSLVTHHESPSKTTMLVLALSADGLWVASGARDGIVKIWDVRSGREVLTLQGHCGWITALAFSVDAKLIASASTDSTVKIWDAETGRNALTLQGHQGTVDAVAFSPDGERVASGAGGGIVKVWDAGVGHKVLDLGAFGVMEEDADPLKTISAIAFSPDGRRIVGAGLPSMGVRDAETGRHVSKLCESSRALLGSVLSVAFSPDGERIVSGSVDKSVRVWHAATGRKVLTLRGHNAPVADVAFGAGGLLVASASLDNAVKLWHADPQWVRQTVVGHSGNVDAVAFSPDGRKVASGSWDKTVKVWDAETGRELMTLAGHGNYVSSVAFSPDGERIVSGSWDNTLKVWDVETGRDVLTLQGHDGPVEAVAFSPDGRRLASGSYDKTVKIWQMEAGRDVLTLQGHDGRVEAVAFSPDGCRIASGSCDNTVRLWDADSGVEVLTLRSRDTVTEWDVEGWKQVTRRRVFDVGLAVAFSPGGKRIVSAHHKTVRVWDAKTGQKNLTLTGHARTVSSVAYSPDGKRIASGSCDNTVRLWDADSGRELLTLQAHDDFVTAVAFSPDGCRLASGSSDETIRIWDARPPHESAEVSLGSGKIPASALYDLAVVNERQGMDVTAYELHQEAAAATDPAQAEWAERSRWRLDHIPWLLKLSAKGDAPLSIPGG